MNVADKNRVNKRFSRNFQTYNLHATVQREVARALVEQVKLICNGQYQRILEIGCGTGFLTEHIVRAYQIEKYYVNDLSDQALNELQGHLNCLQFNLLNFISGDAETVQLPQKLDAIFSASCFQWFEDLDLFFKRMHALLNKDGVLAFSTYGESNFKEIKEITDIGLSYLSLDEYKEVLSKDYKVLCAREWIREKSFSSPYEVLKHMKYTGVNAVSDKKMTRHDLQVFDMEYRARFSNSDESVSLTYHPIIILAKKR